VYIVKSQRGNNSLPNFERDAFRTITSSLAFPRDRHQSALGNKRADEQSRITLCPVFPETSIFVRATIERNGWRAGVKSWCNSFSRWSKITMRDYAGYLTSLVWLSEGGLAFIQYEGGRDSTNICKAHARSSRMRNDTVASRDFLLMSNFQRIHPNQISFAVSNIKC